MKEKDLRDKFESIEWIDKISLGDAGFSEYEFYIPDNQVNQCVQIAIDYAREEAIGFSQWMHENTVKDAKFYTVILDVVRYNQTLTECYQIFKTKENER